MINARKLVPSALTSLPTTRRWGEGKKRKKKKKNVWGLGGGVRKEEGDGRTWGGGVVGGGGSWGGGDVTGQVFEWQCLPRQGCMRGGPVVNDYYRQIPLRLLAMPGC